VFWAPWLPQPEVYCLYGLAGVTLMPTTLEEGFGLVAVESVTRGVPVVARPAGNLRLLAERFPGVYPADEVTEMVRAAAAVSGRPVPPEQRRAVCEAFSVTAQRAAVTAALAGAVSRV
jgi:glycosyltransferase involved in cell wall biosynthesis